ncbi:LOW QUALITY PROTEIN: myozenin-2-like [Brachionichthys hirsutus]|uniref:LOW QUALITY PROTEIN: myozenin-2-like n=1 Tax=Brachionichthys hirsutus TaxID=412623 RepID=UPI0036053492
MTAADGKASSRSGNLNLISPLLSGELNTNDSSRADSHLLRSLGGGGPAAAPPPWQEAQAPNRVALTGPTRSPLIFLTSNAEETGTAGDPPPPIGSFRTGAAMSNFSTVTTGERKLQAAAICGEVEAREDVEMDLGKKVSIPKDVMLEELSLASNRGSRLFKMRQKRSEKYTFESVQNERGGRVNTTVVSQTERGVATESLAVAADPGTDGSPEARPETPKTRSMPSPNCIAPRYGAPLKDVPPEKFNRTAVPKAYQSPWQQHVIHEPGAWSKPPAYISFNRVATPFGGFTKAGTLQADPLPDYPQLRVSVDGPASCPAASHEPVLIPESDDL